MLSFEHGGRDVSVFARHTAEVSPLFDMVPSMTLTPRGCIAAPSALIKLTYVVLSQMQEG